MKYRLILALLAAAALFFAPQAGFAQSITPFGSGGGFLSGGPGGLDPSFPSNGGNGFFVPDSGSGSGFGLGTGGTSSFFDSPTNGSGVLGGSNVSTTVLGGSGSSVLGGSVIGGGVVGGSTIGGGYYSPASPTGSYGGGAIGDLLCQVAYWFLGSLGQGIATLSVIVLGIGALMGKVSQGTALTTMVGISVIFGAPNIVYELTGVQACYY